VLIESLSLTVAFLAGLTPGSPTLASSPPPPVIELTPAPLVASIDEERVPLIARKVAWCESRYDGQAKNPYSTASGYFQFLDGTWEWVTGLPAPARDYPYTVQLEAWETLWDGVDGARHWAPSEHCWSKDRPWN